MTSPRSFLVLLMTTLMLTTSLAGCLGGDDGSSEPDANTDNDNSTVTATADADSDGVIDILDQCPNEAGPLDSNDRPGCPNIVFDADSDGIPDEDDACPDTPADEENDANGCSQSQLDEDGDGIADSEDQCPNTPTNEENDANGCSASQRDSDDDGVSDADDECDGQDDTVDVDADDIPDCIDPSVDSDGDGVLDEDDQCANTPAGITVDETGCEVIPVEVIEVKIGVLTPRTGANSHLSEGLENAAQLAISDINAAQNSYEFSLVYFDTQSSGSRAHQGTWSLIEGDGVSGIIGGSSMPILEQGITKPVEHQIPIITPFVSDGGMEEIADDGLIWRVIPSESDSAHPSSMWANVYELSGVAIIHIDNGFGRSYARMFTEAYGEENICGTFAYPANQIVFDREAGSYQGPFHGGMTVDAGCQNFVIATNYDSNSQTAALIEELKQNIYDARIVTSHHIPGPHGADAFFENMTDESRLAGMVGGKPMAWESALLPGFNTQYLNEFGVSAPSHAGSSYDATMILAQAAIMAGSAAGSDIKATIPAVGTDYAGIGGNIDFDSHGNTPGMMYELFRFEVDGGGTETTARYEEMGFWGPAEGISAKCRDNANSMLIGMLSPQTGIHSPYATGQENSVQLGVELLNINQRGLCFSLVIADTESTQSGAATAMQNLVDSGVVGVIGPHSTEEALGALPVAESNEIPMITFGAFSDEAMEEAWEDCDLTCTPEDYGYLWRVAPGQEHHVSALSALISSDGHSNVAILHDDGKDHTAIANGLASDLGSTCSTQSFAEAQSDFSSEVLALGNCDAVVILAGVTDGAAILAEIHTQGLEIAMIGGHGMGDIALLSAVSDLEHMEGLKGIRMGIDHDLAEYDHPLKYVYNMNYHSALPSYAGWAGDATLILGTAVSLADVNNAITGKRVNEMGIPSAADDYAVSSGEITLSTSDGFTSHSNMDIYSWGADGEFTEIGRWRADIGLIVFES
ncbi:MAG: ABC transporter substrate-binding protein [Candidatus Thermoplasmatota archaeon]|nr:ABC transporter substrate-binding protein [Candidatus Thermoplasmatota archaeon]